MMLIVVIVILINNVHILYYLESHERLGTYILYSYVGNNTITA